jgi:hypothetical protein
VCGQFHVAVTSTLGREPHPGTDLVGGWVGPRTGQEAVEKGNFSCPTGKITLDLNF